MSYTALQFIQVRAPSFATDSRINTMLDMASQEIGSEPSLNAMREKAKALLVMHWLTLEQRGNGVSGSAGAAGGAITSETEGSLSRSYGSSGVALAERYPDLTLTAFGLELIGLYRKTIISVRNRMV